MVNPFVNRSEHRLRSFWRLLIETVLLVLAFILSGLALTLVALAWLSISGRIAPGLRDIAPALTDALNSIPLLGVLSGLLTLLAILLSVWAAGRWLDRRPFSDFGFHLSRGWWRDFGFGLALGAFLMLLIFCFEYVMGWVTVTALFSSPNGNFAVAIAEGLLGFIFVGIYEELFSRGYQLRNLAEGLNWPQIGPRASLLLAYFLTSLVFGALHTANPNATSLTTLQLMLAGLFLGLGIVLTGELAIPIGIHITWNFFQGPVFGFPVSGTTGRASFLAIQQAGPVLWTGGAWGPEGGLAGILALALGAALIILWVRTTRGSAGLDEALSVYRPRAGRAKKLGADQAAVEGAR